MTRGQSVILKDNSLEWFWKNLAKYQGLSQRRLKIQNYVYWTFVDPPPSSPPPPQPDLKNIDKDTVPKHFTVPGKNTPGWRRRIYFFNALAFIESVSFPFVDVDPDRIRIQWGPESGTRRAKLPKKNLSVGCSLLRPEGFSCSLHVLYGGLGVSNLQFLLKTRDKKFSSWIFFPIFVSQNPGSGSGFTWNA